MQPFALDAETALNSIGGWQDPCDPPVLHLHDGIMVVRDDLLPAGAKSRFIDVLVNNHVVDEWVYGSSPRVGYGQISLAYVACCRYGKRATVLVAKGKELHPNSLRAQRMGAKIIEVPTGFMKVCEARARDYVNTTKGAFLLPFGLADTTVYGSIVRVARALSYEPEEVWTVAGSGVLNRGLQLAWPNAKCFMVSVGHQLTAEEIGRATVYRHHRRFEQPVERGKNPPFPSVENYDAKAWEYIQKYADKSKRVLFWNVGA
jgi:hypothetical protein